MKKLLLYLIIATFPLLLAAQDAHYNTEQFGNRSMLLSGAVIGSVEDLGAVFYNPARLALQENPSFILSAKAYQLVTLKVAEGAGKADLSNQAFGSAPTLIAGSFDVKGVKWLKKIHHHKFAYAFLSRQAFDYTLNARIQRSYDYNPDWVGDDDLYGNFNWNKSMREDWVGFTWAIPVSKEFSIGISNFIAVTTQTSLYEYNLQGLGTLESGDQQVASFTRNRNRSFRHIGYVAKIGFNYERSKLSLGLSITPPKVNIHGSGEVLYEEILAGYENSLNPENQNTLLSNQTENVDVLLKSPLSVGFGLGYKLGNHVLHLSGEWYNKVNKYNVVTPEPFKGQSSGEEIPNQYIDQRKSIINSGIGMEWNISDSLKFYTSFSTDFSSLDVEKNNDFAEINAEIPNSIFVANIYNYGMGFSWMLKRIDITFGAVYSRGIQPVGHIIEFPGSPDNPNTGEPEITDMLWERWKVLIGFTLPFYKFGSDN